jgi:S-adenosylmethionine:tRNA ribosyltransferase-isomerase
MRITEFDFDLPTDRIAQRPVEPRDAARLLHVGPGRLSDRGVLDLPSLLKPGDLLVFNDTKVVPARLSGHRGAAKVSVTLHQPIDGERWRVFAKPAKRLRPGDVVAFADDFSAAVITRHDEGDVTLLFDRTGPALGEALRTHGSMPLPPYIRRGVADVRDGSDYQTIFARNEGAVAAPTAALHFTPALLDTLRSEGIRMAGLTLHVGAGTFLPVRGEDTVDHVMHAEIGYLSPETAAEINATHERGGQVVAIGTTSLRLIETAARDDGKVEAFAGPTSLFITPGYQFKAVDRLLTNFHLPRSTLFMLVAAFAGLDRMRHAYAHARDTGYRFYSYGDCCLLDRSDPR